MPTILDLTIAIPCYNEGRALLLKILSLLQHDFVPSHILVYNDGSTDDSITCLPLLNFSRDFPYTSIEICESKDNLGIHKGIQYLLSNVHLTSWVLISAVGDFVSPNLLKYFNRFILSHQHDHPVKLLFGNTIEYWPETNTYSDVRTISKRLSGFRYFTPIDNPLFASLVSGILPASNSYFYHISIINELSSILSDYCLYHAVDIVAYMFLVERYDSFGLFPDPITITERLPCSLGSRLSRMCDYKVLCKAIFRYNLSFYSKSILYRYLSVEVLKRTEPFPRRLQKLASLVYLYISF